MSKELCIVCNRRPGVYEVETGVACELHARKCNACGLYTTKKTASLWGFGWYLCSREECVKNKGKKRQNIETLYKFAKERAKIERPWFDMVKKILGIYFLANFLLMILTTLGVYLFIMLNNLIKWMPLDQRDSINYLFFKQFPTILLLGIFVFPVELMNEANRFFQIALGVSSSILGFLTLFLGILISISCFIISYSIVSKLTDPWRKL